MKTVHCVFLIILFKKIISQDQLSDFGQTDGQKLIQRIEFIDGYGRRLLGYTEAESTDTLQIFCRAITLNNDDDIEIKVIHTEKASSIAFTSKRSVKLSPVTDTVLLCKVTLSITKNEVRTQLVIRANRPIRLFGGNAIHRGRLQVKSDDNVWLDVCDKNFDLKITFNGLVACRQLGFSNVEAVIDGKNFSTSTDADEILFFGYIFNCTGTESTLSICRTSRHRKCTGLYGATGLICQASPLRPAIQTQVLLSNISDINPVLTLSNYSNSLQENVISATCTLTVQLPRSQIIKFTKSDRWGVETDLSNNLKQWTVQFFPSNLMKVSVTYRQVISREDIGKTFICVGIDKLSGLSRGTSEKVTYGFGLKSVEIIQSIDTDTTDNIFYCMADITDPPVTYSWIKKYFIEKSNITEDVPVSGQYINLQENSSQNRYLVQFCCKAVHTINNVSYHATVCKKIDNMFKSTIFTTNGNRGPNGTIQFYKVPFYGCYKISAFGAAGGNHTTQYGGPSDKGGSWYGGLGASLQATIVLNKGIILSVVVGQHGGNSSEISPGRSDGSIEDNAGTGGGGGTFIYATNPLKIFFAVGGGGGASFGFDGVAGQNTTNGASSVGRNPDNQRKGGTAGQPGESNLIGASYKGGVGAGWLGAGKERIAIQHGDRGSSRLEGWIGGNAGYANNGAEGGYGGGGGGAEDNGASGGGGGYSGGGSGTHAKSAGGGGGSFCAAEVSSCTLAESGNKNIDGKVEITLLGTFTCRTS